MVEEKCRKTVWVNSFDRLKSLFWICLLLLPQYWQIHSFRQISKASPPLRHAKDWRIGNGRDSITFHSTLKIFDQLQLSKNIIYFLQDAENKRSTNGPFKTGLAYFVKLVWSKLFRLHGKMIFKLKPQRKSREADQSKIGFFFERERERKSECEREIVGVWVCGCGCVGVCVCVCVCRYVVGPLILPQRQSLKSSQEPKTKVIC